MLYLVYLNYDIDPISSLSSFKLQSGINESIKGIRVVYI